MPHVYTQYIRHQKQLVTISLTTNTTNMACTEAPLYYLLDSRFEFTKWQIHFISHYHMYQGNNPVMNVIVPLTPGYGLPCHLDKIIHSNIHGYRYLHECIIRYTHHSCITCCIIQMSTVISHIQNHRFQFIHVED